MFTITASIAIACSLFLVLYPARRRTRLDFASAPTRKLERIPPEMHGIWVGRRAQQNGPRAAV